MDFQELNSTCDDCISDLSILLESIDSETKPSEDMGINLKIHMNVIVDEHVETGHIPVQMIIVNQHLEGVVGLDCNHVMIGLIYVIRKDLT